MHRHRDDELDGTAPAPDDDEPVLSAETSSVLGKVRLLLEAFDVDRDLMSLAELSRATGLAKATVHRLAGEMVEWGILERSGVRYQLGLRIFEIGQRVAQQRILRDAARPFMERLMQSTGEAVHLAVRDGLDVMYVEKLSPNELVARPSRIAGRLPLHCTATGKVLLAHADSAVFESVVERGLARLTRATITSPQRLLLEVQGVRARGHAVEQEELRYGYVSVAVPVHGAGRSVVAALSVTATSGRADVNRYSSLLKQVGASISTNLERSEFG